MGLRSHWPQALGLGLWPLRFPSPPGARAPAMAEVAALEIRAKRDTIRCCSAPGPARAPCSLGCETSMGRQSQRSGNQSTTWDDSLLRSTRICTSALSSRPQEKHGHFNLTALEIREKEAGTSELPAIVGKNAEKWMKQSGALSYGSCVTGPSGSGSNLHSENGPPFAERMVEDIRALGLRHVGYGIPTDLFGPSVTACVQVVRMLSDDDAAEEAFRWSLSLISRILTRVINEGSTIVMKAINFKQSTG